MSKINSNSGLFSRIKDNISFLFFPISVIWMEIVIRIFTIRKFSFGIIRSFTFSIVVGLVLYLLSTFFSAKTNRIIGGVFLFFITVLFMTQTVYFKIFEVFMTFYSLFHGTGQVAQFWKQAFIGIFKSLPSLILIALPLVFYIIMLKKKVPLLEKTGLQKKLVALLSAFAFY
ncbi:MAG: hypothetical protein J5874_05445, partial [Oscillospiraceae bacterium]|nr:hypothetical protein [Oscillospiraceae bacterium]